MKFEEDLAKKIIAQYSLSDSTLKVWRSRGSIPDKYSDTDYKPREVISKVRNVKHDRLVDLLKSGKIVVRNFAELVGVSEHKLNEAISAKQTLLSESDLLKCEVELKKLKFEIVRTFQTFLNLNLIRLLNSPVIAYSVIVHDKQLTNKISYIRSGKGEPDRALWNDLKDKYIVFAMQIQL